jgi:hypothetical protein
MSPKEKENEGNKDKKEGGEVEVCLPVGSGL